MSQKKKNPNKRRCQTGLAFTVKQLGEALNMINHELSIIRDALNQLSKVAHYHGEPEVKEKLETTESANEQEAQ